MNNNPRGANDRSSPAAVLLCTVLIASTGSVFADAEQERATWRIEVANDTVFDSDNQFTNGFSIHKHSRTFSSLDETSGTPAFGKSLARFFLPDEDGLLYREGWAFGQNMQTPEEIELEELILNDIPFVGMLGWANSFIAFDDRRFTGFQWLMGWVGPEAGGEPVQKAAHELTGARTPRGWDNQLDNEPILNLYYMGKHKLWRYRHFDTALNYDAALGNFFTFGQVSLETRFGRMPGGFTFIPDPLGRGMDYEATIREPGRSYLYGTVVARGTGILHALPRQGNSFRDDNPWTENNVIDMKRIVGQLIFGVHYERPRWGIHLSFWLSTKTLDEDTLTGVEDPENSFGAIMLEWKF